MLLAADLRITLADQPNEVIAGKDLFYDVTVRNFGVDVATDVVVTDTFPAGIIYLSDSSGDTDGADVTTVGAGLARVDTVEFELGDLAVGATKTFQVKVKVPADFVANTTTGSKVIFNTATVASSNVAPDPDPSDNTATEATFVTELAELVVTVIEEPAGTVPAGSNILGATVQYSILVDNLGPSAARNVVLRDTLFSSGDISVPGAAFSVSQGGGSITQFTVSTSNFVPTQFGTDVGTFRTNFLLPFGVDDTTMPATITGRLRAVVRVTANEALHLTNTLRAATDTPESDTTNNFAESQTVVTAVADLQATSVFSAEKHVVGQPSTLIDTNALPPMPEAPFYNLGGTTVTAGRRIEWSTTVTNSGPSTAQNVQIEVLLPFGASLIENTLSADPNPGPGVVAGRASTESAGELRTKVIAQYGALASGESASVKFQLLVDPSLPPGTQLSIDAIATSETYDKNLSNNSNSIQFDTDNAGNLSKTDLSVTKSGPATAEPGEIITYTLTVENLSPVEATNVELQDFLPAGLSVISISVPGSLAGVPGDPLRPSLIPLGTLAGNSSQVVTIVAQVANSVPDQTILFNDALVSSTIDDADASNNAVHSATNVIQTANGNVKAVFSRGNLTITGDKFNNKILVEAVPAAGPDAFRITPLGGTKLNGSFESFQVHGITGNVALNMLDGNDTVLFTGPLTFKKNLTVALGRGNDLVELATANVAGTTTIKGEAGDDTLLVLDSVFGGNASLNLGDGNDTMLLSGVTTFNKNLTVAMGKDNDQLDLANVAVLGATSIDTDRGDDTVNVADSVFGGNFSLNTKDGNDTALFSGVSTFNKNLTVALGRGNDLLEIDSASILGNTAINADRDDDTIRLLNSTLAGKLDLRTGTGADTVLLDTVDVTGVTTIRNDNNDDTVTVADSIFGAAISFLGGRGFDTLDANEVTKNNTYAVTPIIRSFENILP